MSTPTNTPQIGRLAQLVIDGAIAGYCTSYEVSEEGNVVQEYVLGQTSAAQWGISVMGNLTGNISMEHLYVDDTYANLLEAGAAIEIIDYPLGPVTGKPMHTYSVIVSSATQSVEQEAIVTFSLEAVIIAPPIRAVAP